MFDRKYKIRAFKALSDLLLYNDNQSNDEVRDAMMSFKEAVRKAIYNNVWFTEDSVAFAVKQIGMMLEGKNLERWLAAYPEKNITEPKTVGVVMAGNIPMVGFHDFLCVLMSGHRFLGKLSHDDQFLLPALGDLLCAFDSNFREMMSFTTEKLTHFDVVIATGSDNTSRYFDYYFGKYPNIIRKNRNAIAIIRGEENRDDYERLAIDVFTYFGLGCRSVSTLLVPRGFDFQPMLDAFAKYDFLKEYSHYFHNYEYMKAICLVDGITHYDNGFLLIKKGEALASPVAVLNFQEYDSLEQVGKFITENCEAIQCVVCKNAFMEKSFDFGEAQSPKLSDYADGIDTMDFMMNLK